MNKHKETSGGWHFSVRTTLGLIISLMGMLGLLLALISGEIHKQHAYQNQTQSMQKLIRLKADDLLRDLAMESTELGVALQSENGFRQAFLAGNMGALDANLATQFTRYFVTASVIRLERLIVLDTSLAFVTEESAEHREHRDTSGLPCPHLLERARSRSGPERLKVMSTLCVIDDHPFHAVLVSIGGLTVKGYLMVVTDPTHSLLPIEDELGMPIMLRLPSGKISYRSKHWPSPEMLANSFIVEHVLLGEDGLPALSIALADDIRPLFGHLPQTRLVAMAAAATLTLIALILATWVLRRTVLNPLQTLTQKLRLVQTDRSHLGEQVTIGGSREIRELGENFNAMSQELGKLTQALETMAYTDQLTDLPNRNLFQKQLHGFMKMHRHMHQPFALYLMDVDRFKAINDTLGHHVGDQLLRAVGERIENALRGGDMVTRLNESALQGFGKEMIARLGGDEFAAILPNVRTAEDASIAAQKLLRAMEEPFIIDGHKLLVGLSIGASLFPLHASDNHELVRKADVAMYQAKKTRRGFAPYEPKFDQSNMRHLILERDMHLAVLQNQLAIHYQPKIDLKRGVITGAEALVRWLHPDLGVVSPDEFISLAEQSGTIIPIMHWVLNKAIEDRASLHTDGCVLSVSVNLSAVNLRDGGLVDAIAAVLERWHTRPACLTLELTESAVMADPGHALKVLTRLHDMGVGLSIDDFGTGYSSLAYIKRLPVNEIKIDKSFINDMLNDSSDEAIIRSVLVLAHHTRLSVVAEGVEDEASYERLRELGCDHAQGYFIAHPMPLAEFRVWAEQSRWKVSCPHCVEPSTVGPGTVQPL